MSAESADSPQRAPVAAGLPPAPRRASPLDDADAPKQADGRPALVPLQLLVSVSTVVAIALLANAFVVQSFRIPSSSMLPTLDEGDRVLVEKIGYYISDPGRGDIVVLHRAPAGERRDLPWYEDLKNDLRELLGLPVQGDVKLIKRVVAVEGDVIRYAGAGALYLNGVEIDEPYIDEGLAPGEPLPPRRCRSLGMIRTLRGCVVPHDKVIVMGDNRGASKDSRSEDLGPVDESSIVGRALTVFWPLTELGPL